MTPWQQRLAATAAGTVPGLFVRLSGGPIAYPLQLVAYGAAVVTAAFMLAWACEAAQVDVARGAVVAAVAFVAILPEYIVEVHFAFTGRADYVTANLTGASRLLLGVCVALPAAVAALPPRWRPGRVGPIALAPAQRVELAILALAALWALRCVFTGRLTLLDALVLVSLYGLYLRRAGASGTEASEPVGVAAALAELPADQRRRWVRRPHAVRRHGDPAHRCAVRRRRPRQRRARRDQPVPAAAVGGADRHRGARAGRGVRAADARPRRRERGGAARGSGEPVHARDGTLPIAYLVGAGTGPLPLAGRERVELFLSIAVALYAVAALVGLRLSRGDAAIMFALFSLQFLLAAVFTRAVLALVFMALAIDVLAAERRHLPSLVAALLPTARPRGAGRGGAFGRSPPARPRAR